MAGHENTLGFQHGNESILNCQSSGLSTNVSQMAISCVSMAKPSASDVANPFLGSSTWNPLVSLNPNQSLGGSSLVSHSEFANNSSYPRVLENQGMSSTSHLVQYMSDSNFAEMVSKVTSFGSGSFSEMVGSFGQPGCVDIANNTGYQPNFNANKEEVIERTPINPAQSQNEDLAPEEGTAGSTLDGNSRKRGFDSNSPFSANKKAEGELGKDSSGKSSDGVKEQDGKKQKFEQHSSADLRGKHAKDNSQSGEAPKENFIHVRARRGQATNSHSLAERVRREKISERMRLLQELVPGCNKITGKAVMLDEIINYVQSLQQQVEFLSMKLATVNPEFNFDVERILSKDILQSHIGSGSMLGYGSGINSSLPFPSGSFLGTIPNIPQYPPLPQNVLDQDFQRLFGMGYNSGTPLDNLGPNGRLKPEL